MNYSKFLKEWQRGIDRLIKDSEKTTRGTAISIFSQIIKESPVKTGLFRNNWQTSLGKPETDIVSSPDRQATAALTSMKAATSSYKIGQTLFMSNNLPYAYALSQGHSKQRPAGWIQRIVMGFQQTVDREAKKNK